jgi:hypothetical protein
VLVSLVLLLLLLPLLLHHACEHSAQAWLVRARHQAVGGNEWRLAAGGGHLAAATTWACRCRCPANTALAGGIV